MTPDDPRHGRHAGYVAGCRCSACTDAHALYERCRRAEARWGSGSRMVSSLGVRRRVQALQALGWSAESLSVRLGFTKPWLRGLTTGDSVARRNHDLVARLFDELSMTVPPSNPYTRQSRADARRRGYLPPLAWDNIDDPDEQPHMRDARPLKTDVDPIVVQRVLAGDRLPTTAAEKREIAARWGRSQKELEQLTGWNVARVLRETREAS